MSIFMPIIPREITEERYTRLKKENPFPRFLYRRTPFDVIDDNLLVMAVDAVEAYGDAMQLNKLQLIYMTEKKMLIKYVDECETYSEFLSSILSYCTSVSKEKFVHPFDIEIPESISTNHSSEIGHTLSDSTKAYFLKKSRNQVLGFWEFLTRKEIEIITLKSGAIKETVFSDDQIIQLLGVTESEIKEAVETIEEVNHYYIRRNRLKDFLD